MSTRVAVGISPEDAGVDSFAEAAGRAAAALGGPADLVLVFCGAANLEYAEEGLAAVRERLRPAALLGCGAQGVVGNGREVEDGGVSVWAGAFPGGEVDIFHLAGGPAGSGEADPTGLPDLDRADAALLLVDPYRFPAEALLSDLARRSPGLPVIGGIASAGPGPAPLLYGERALAAGAVGAVLRGLDVRACVSQGARPIGPEMVITAADGNVVHELASEPALERLTRAVAELDPRDQALAVRGLLVGIVIDPNKPSYERGDFLIRALAGADQETGAIAVGAQVRVGQTVRLQVRDAASADEDLAETLDRQLHTLERPAAGALLFTCNGRGSHMFGTADHDARAVTEALSGAPTGGFFCAGEIGPVGHRSFVHGFTATLAVFPT